MLSVLGIDLAPRHTGFCVVPRDWDGRLESLITDKVTYTLTGKMGPGAQMRVYLAAAKVAVQMFKQHQVDEVAVEGYAYGAKGSAVTLLAELGGIVKSQLYMACDGLLVTPVTASGARAWLTGGLRGARKTDKAEGIKPLPKKKQVEVFLRNRGFTFETTDILDSFVAGYYHWSRKQSRDPIFEPAHPSELVVPLGVGVRRRGRRGQ
jgi:Holliday junction resolvasome RuvABC endonuclease subunit